MGEWSSHSSEGETDPEEQEEEEAEGEEEGVTGDPSPIRLRSHTSTVKVWHSRATTVQPVTVQSTHQP